MKSYYLEELKDSINRKELWLYLAWFDIKMRYRRTKLGPLWMVLFSFISIVCIAMLGSVLFRVKFGDFFPYVTCGMVIWTYMAAIITDSCLVYLSQIGLIKNTNVPLLNFGLRMFVRNTIVFLHSMIIVALIILYYKVPITLNLLYLLPAFLLFSATALSLSIILGFICTRYRDFLQFIQSTIGLLAFVTPIMWKPEMLGSKAYLVNFNPLTHYVAIMRQPFLGNSPSMLNMLVVTAFTFLLLVLSYALFNRYRKRLVHWL